MSAIPYMPFYIADYLADASHLNLDEHGAYLLLIMKYWQTGKPLPADDRKLAKILHVPLAKFLKLKKSLMEFFLVTDTEWQHSRIEKELAIYRTKAEKARVAGQISAQKKKERKSTSVEQPLSERSTYVEQTFNHTDADTDTDTYVKDKDDHNMNCDGENSQNANSSPPDPPDVEIPKLPDCPHQQIIDLYHTKLPTNPRVLKWTNGRGENLRARWKEHPHIELWDQFFEIVSESKFLTGQKYARDKRPFFASLDWLVKPENFAKVLENRYGE